MADSLVERIKYLRWDITPIALLNRACLRVILRFFSVGRLAALRASKPSANACSRFVFPIGVGLMRINQPDALLRP